MKKSKITAFAAMAASLFLMSGCLGGARSDAAENVAKHLSKPPKNWYEETLNYYVYGAETGWKDDSLYGDLPEEMKNPDNHAGYYLADLNDDGTKELMIGYNDGGEATKFFKIYIYHPDLENHVYCSFSTNGEGYYIYLCDGNVVRNDWEYPGQKEPKSDYMKLNKDPVDGWPIQEYDSDPPKPMKCTIVPFDEVSKALESKE